MKDDPATTPRIVYEGPMEPGDIDGMALEIRDELLEMGLDPLSDEPWEEQLARLRRRMDEEGPPGGE